MSPTAVCFQEQACSSTTSFNTLTIGCQPDNFGPRDDHHVMHHSMMHALHAITGSHFLADSRVKRPESFFKTQNKDKPGNMDDFHIAADLHRYYNDQTSYMLRILQLNVILILQI